MNKYYFSLAVSMTVILVDQVSKFIVRSTIPLYSSVKVLPVLDFTHIRNPGVAFGMLKNLPDSIRLPFFVIVLVAALIVVIYIIKNTDHREKPIIFSLSLILGGAFGNSIDRFRLGYVTDFIDLHWFNYPGYHWPPFNISDSCITIGAISILLLGIFYNRSK